MHRALFFLALLVACQPAARDDDDSTTADDDDDSVVDDDDTGDDDDTSSTEQPDVDAADIVGDAYSHLVIELDAVEGHGPTAAALTAFEDEVERLIGLGAIAKDSFEIVLDDTLPANPDPDHVYTFEEQQDLSEGARDLPAEADTAYIHMLYLDGGSELDGSNSSVLGYAYGGSWIVMFRDNIDGACDGSTVLDLLSPGAAAEACSMTEAGVLTHEAGHLFGLVNNGAPMQTDHQDDANGAHCDNEDCLMYWLAETSSAADTVANRYLGGGSGFPPFDDDCVDDLRALAE